MVLKLLIILLILIIGFLECFFGYSLFRISLLVAGFIVGFSSTRAVYAEYFPAETHEISCFIIAVMIGVCVALLSFVAYRLGFFLLGFLVSLGIFTSIYQRIFVNVPPHFFVVLIFIFVGVAVGILTVYFQKPLTIFTTSILGSALIVNFSAMLIGEFHFFEESIITEVFKYLFIFIIFIWGMYVQGCRHKKQS